MSGFPNNLGCGVRLAESYDERILNAAPKPVVSENDRTWQMFKSGLRRTQEPGLEVLHERPCSTVDKSRQGSHSLANANVCEMFHETLIRVSCQLVSATRVGGPPKHTSVHALLTIIIRSE